jgi:hypothetical protein
MDGGSNHDSPRNECVAWQFQLTIFLRKGCRVNSAGIFSAIPGPHWFVRPTNAFCNAATTIEDAWRVTPVSIAVSRDSLFDPAGRGKHDRRQADNQHERPGIGCGLATKPALSVPAKNLFGRRHCKAVLQ